MHVEYAVRWWRVRWRSGRWRVRAAFAMDAEQAPAVIYTDELDAFGDRARPRDHNSSYTDYIITGLLDLIDGFHDHQGGLVMGATNHNRPLLAEIAQVLGDTGLLSGPRLADLLHLFGAGRALRPARSSVSPVRAMPDSCCVRAACFLVIHSHPAFPAPDSGERSRTSVYGASAPRATWPV